METNIRNSILALLVFFSLCSCSKKKGNDRPMILLSEEKMVEVMCDIHVIESDLNYKKSMGDNTITLKDSYYDQLFKHYRINDVVFDENIKYYTQKLDVLEKIMDQVQTKMQEQQNKFYEQQVEEQQAHAN